MGSRIRILMAFLLVAGALESQAAVIVVSPAGAVTQIASAVASALENDVILVKSGTYAGFTVNDKGLWIVGDLGATVTVTGTIEILNLAAGKTVVLRNLKGTNSTGTNRDALNVSACLGRIRLEQVTLRGRIGTNFVGFTTANGGHGARVVNGSDVAFMRSTLEGGDGASLKDDNVQTVATAGGDGLSSLNSNVVLADATLLGGRGGSDSDKSGGHGGNGGDGGNVDGGTVYASGSAFQGDSGGSGGPFGLFACCGDGGNGGDGIELRGGALLRSLQNTFVGASGGAPGCPTCGSPPNPQAGIAGVPIQLVSGSVTSLGAVARHNSVTTPIREGQLVTHSFSGVIGDSVLLAVATGAGNTYLGAYQGPYLLAPPAFFFGFGTLTTANSSVSLVIPELGPGISAVTLHVQAFFVSGGSAVLGPVTEHLLLDASF